MTDKHEAVWLRLLRVHIARLERKDKAREARRLTLLIGAYDAAINELPPDARVAMSHAIHRHVRAIRDEFGDFEEQE